MSHRAFNQKLAALDVGFGAPGAKTLLGAGAFIMTIDQGPDMDRYQGVTPIEGEQEVEFTEEELFDDEDYQPDFIKAWLENPPLLPGRGSG